MLHKVYGHHGAPIWCIDISNDNRNVLTGGADGSVYAWPVASCNSSEISLPYDDMRNIPKHISYLSSGTILLFDEKGTLLYYNRGDKTPSDSLYLEKYRSYCIMQVSPCRSSIAIASIEGYVIIYKGICTHTHTHICIREFFSNKNTIIFLKKILYIYECIFCVKFLLVPLADVIQSKYNFRDY